MLASRSLSSSSVSPSQSSSTPLQTSTSPGLTSPLPSSQSLASAEVPLGWSQAVVVAPLQYTLLIWGTMYGYLVFGQLPDGWTFAGALIIVATGLYTFYREWVVARERRTITGK